MTTEDDKRGKLWLKLIIILIFVCGLFVGLAIKKDCEPIKKLQDNILTAFNSSIIVKEQSYGSIFYDLEEEKESGAKVWAWTTGYNSLEAQTDSTPCIASSGYICGRKQVVACPRSIPLGTWVKIGNTEYECMDRLATKYDDRFDIFFDKDVEGAINYGLQYREITILN